MPLEALHFSRLKFMAQSPAHFAAAHITTTSAMEVGTASHSMLLGGQEVITWEDGRPRRGKDFDAYKADHPGALILPARDYARAQSIAVAVKRNPLAMRVLEGQRELALTWKFGNRECAGRLDCLGNGFVTELKTTRTADPERLPWQAMRMGWFAQLAWYMDGAMAAKAGTPEAAYVVAVESAAPHAVTVGRVNPEDLEKGRATYRGWLERLLVCEASDEWPAYSQAVVDLRMPDNDVELDFGDTDAAA